MSTLPPNLAITPWTCPHCKAVWHSGRQYCIDCGYGMAPSATANAATNGQATGPPQGPPTLADLMALVAGRAETPSIAELRTLVEDRKASLVDRTPDRQADLEAQLQRSLAAESNLQAELTPLRGRIGQLEQQVQAQRQQLVEGVQRLLAPLVDVLKRYGWDAQGAQCIPCAVQVIEQGRTELAAYEQAERARMEQAARPEPRTGSHQVWDALRQLSDEIKRINAQVQELGPAQGIQPRQEEVPAPPEGYGTWVITDRVAHDLEQSLLQEQTQRGGLAFG